MVEKILKASAQMEEGLKAEVSVSNDKVHQKKPVKQADAPLKVVCKMCKVTKCLQNPYYHQLGLPLTRRPECSTITTVLWLCFLHGWRLKKKKKNRPINSSCHSPPQRDLHSNYSEWLFHLRPSLIKLKYIANLIQLFLMLFLAPIKSLFSQFF